MGTHWTGTVEERMARLERDGVRCDANSRHCPRTAVDEYDVYPADGHGKRKPNAVQVTKKSCSYHRQQFSRNGLWEVVAFRAIPLRSTRRRAA